MSGLAYTTLFNSVVPKVLPPVPLFKVKVKSGKKDIGDDNLSLFKESVKSAISLFSLMCFSSLELGSGTQPCCTIHLSVTCEGVFLYFFPICERRES